MDMNQFFDKDGLRDITSTWRDQHIEDGRQYGQVADVVQRRLEQQSIDGDGAFSAKRRARKVSRQVRRMERHSRKAAAAAEGLYATFVNEVVELPERRAKEIERKANRRERLGIAATVEAAAQKSLTKSAHAFTGAEAGNPQVTPVQAAPQYVAPYPHQFAPAGGHAQPLENITDLFQDFPEAK